MSDDIQDKGTWSSQMNEMDRLSRRAAKLSERGAHYFVGWLIGAGMQKPEMSAEFEKVLHRLENDPDLRHCWRECGNADADATPVEQLTLPIFSETPLATGHVAAVTNETPAVEIQTPAILTEERPGADRAPAAPVAEEAVSEHTLSEMLEFKPESGSEKSGPAGFFAKIFRRQRVAA